MPKPKEINWDMKVKCVTEIEKDKGDGPEKEYKISLETEDGLVVSSISSAVPINGLKPGTPVSLKLVSTQLTMEEFKEK